MDVTTWIMETRAPKNSNGRIAEFARRGERAFTMVEIALSLAVVAFALVAIIGILPAGLQVQRDNREETIINQEGTYLLEAIRNGAEGMEDLSNRVRLIVISNVAQQVEIKRIDNSRED